MGWSSYTDVLGNGGMYAQRWFYWLMWASIILLAPLLVPFWLVGWVVTSVQDR